ncbi:CRP/FNR family transcriptional regulator, anaerobic regulatory protein [Colwellia chukchiensis]|uniref:CRP/FNR family transcriptional regulator, anaerobic regulatory protein n=1 Tax=Colwellia chukchiensis TaxID=641665 RepID=A0A1H7U628_9GAMM|nr:helix-turn-helix domain-containing protein [Colwellia chukchiensis]SEL92431.1 CRP/FNR family transcriptional regulator, anaerobic regulatory protein [Colwellia chukchiensis]
MQPICRPLKAGKTEISIMDSYLSKHNIVSNATPLFLHQEPADAIYAVCAGCFKLTEQSAENNEKVIGFRFPGELIGEDAIHNQHYQYNAVAVGHTSVCKIDLKELNECGKLMPELQLNLITLLSKQNAMLREEFSSVVAKHTAESLLAAFMLNLFKRNSRYQESGTKLYLPVGRDAIANHLGFRRETLSRIFSKFQQKGLLSIQAKNIEILDLAKLEHIAYS